MSTQTEQSIIEKVRSILDRANHPNTPPAEAETALALAQKLITKYNLDESALAQARGVEEGIVRDSIVVKGKYALRRLAVVGCIAQANSCAVYRSVHHEKLSNGFREDGTEKFYWQKDGYELHIFGTQADIFATKVLWASAEALALRTLPKGDKSFRHSWWIGFGDGIYSALKKATTEAVVESGSSALVLVDRKKRAEAELQGTVRLRQVKSTGVTRGNAYSAGRSTGASFSTSGVGRGAIGALNS